MARRGQVHLRSTPPPRPFDDSDALWKTVHLSFRVEDVLAVSDVSIGHTIRFGWVVYGDQSAEEVLNGFKSLGTLVLLLNQGSAVFGYDKSIFDVLEDGAFVVAVDDSGKLSLPFVEAGRDDVLLTPTPTLALLRARAAEDVQVIDLVGRGNALERGGQ